MMVISSLKVSHREPNIIRQGNKKDLSYTQWSEAYETDMMVYIEEHYSKNVRDLKI